MKSIIILFAAFVLSSFSETKVTFTQPQIKEVQDKLEAIYQYIDKSNLPHQDVLQMEKAIRDCYQTLGSGKIDSLRK